MSLPIRPPMGRTRKTLASLVSCQTLAETGFPMFVPNLPGVDLGGWCAAHAEAWQALLQRKGALLFRGFEIGNTAGFARLVQTLSGQSGLAYTYRSTPRTDLGDGVYTSTEYPRSESIPLHNENAYARTWPMKLWFFCAQAASVGGCTPLADSRAILAALDPALVAHFRTRRLMYVRNFAGVDMPWQEVFQTSDKRGAEAFCQKEGITCEWVSADHLRTRQVCQAVATHKLSGEEVWFNQAHLFHIAALAPEVRQTLMLAGEALLPRNVYFGDGSAIPVEDIAHIHQVMAAQARRFPWQHKDLLLVDNMLVAHGRDPYEGERRILVSMTESEGLMEGSL